MMNDIKKLAEMIIKFRDERDWKQFHNPKDVAISISLEASELLEHFQMKSSEEVKEYVKTNKEDIAEELADVLIWVLVMSHDLKINIKRATTDKLKKNIAKYPVEKAKGSNKKYTEL